VFVEGGRLCHGTMAQWPVQARCVCVHSLYTFIHSPYAEQFCRAATRRRLFDCLPDCRRTTTPWFSSAEVYFAKRRRTLQSSSSSSSGNCRRRVRPPDTLSVMTRCRCGPELAASFRYTAPRRSPAPASLSPGRPADPLPPQQSPASAVSPPSASWHDPDFRIAAAAATWRKTRPPAVSQERRLRKLPVNLRKSSRR